MSNIEVFMSYIQDSEYYSEELKVLMADLNSVIEKVDFFQLPELYNEYTKELWEKNLSEATKPIKELKGSTLKLNHSVTIKIDSAIRFLLEVCVRYQSQDLYRYTNSASFKLYRMQFKDSFQVLCDSNSPLDIKYLRHIHNTELKVLSTLYKDLAGEGTVEKLQKLKIDADGNYKTLSKENNKTTESIKTLHSLKEYIENQKSSFYQVLLTKGFHNFASDTKKEMKNTLILLITIAFLMLGLMVASLLYTKGFFGDFQSSKSISINDYFWFIPVISIEILLIYFFRITLHQYNSAKTQLLQLNLRKHVCAYIEGYAKFSIDTNKESKSKGLDNPLEKFESLIFSGLIQESKDLPSTFDGIDALSKAFKNIKGA